MLMPKPPKKFLVDSFEYKEYLGRAIGTSQYTRNRSLLSIAELTEEANILFHQVANNCFITD